MKKENKKHTDTMQYTRQMLWLALPIAGQNLVNFGVNMMDTLMVGQLGELPLAASSLANQLFFIVTLVVYGIGGGANVLVAQYWGKKDKDSIHKVLAYTYRLAMGFALVMALLALLSPEFLMRLFTNDHEVVLEGSCYLRVVSLSYLFYTGTTITTCILRAVQDVKIGMRLSVLSLLVNVGINYVLIFGKLGAPRLGILGAAIGTLCARLVEFVVMLWYVYRREKRLQIRMYKIKKLDPSYRKIYFKVCIPVTMNELLWALGESAVAMILGRMGREVVSANSIYAVVSELSGVVMSGMNAAASVVVGKAIGQGLTDRILRIKKEFQRASVVVGILAALVMLTCRGFIIDFYNVSAVTKTYARQMMLVGAVVELCRSIQCMNIMGILRGGGDVRFAMWNDILFLWLFTIPLGILVGLVWKLPIVLVYVFLKLDQCLKIFTSQWRLNGTAWIKNFTA